MSLRIRSHLLISLGLLLLLLMAAGAQIIDWSRGLVIPGTENITPGPGVDLSGWNQPDHHLNCADLAGGRDLHESTFAHSLLHQAWFIDADLTNANFTGSGLYAADFSRAKLGGAVLVLQGALPKGVSIA